MSMLRWQTILICGQSSMNCRCAWTDMSSTSPVVDSFPQWPPHRSEDPALDQAMLRAYSLERSVDYGCALEDVLKLRRWVDAGYGWVDTALLLADDNERRAVRARETDQPSLAARFWAQAAACCRLAQAALESHVQSRVQVYERQAALFMRSVSASTSADGECIDMQHRGKPHRAWLFRAGPVPGNPVVVVWGGADGWCEAFRRCVPFYTERGLSVCLLELPGQGLARLRHGSTLDASFTDFVSASLDMLIARGAAGDRFGVVGHSAGGSLALAAAAADRRIRACCTNGGSLRLFDTLQKYPRVLQRFGRTMGDDTSESGVRTFLERLDLEGAVRGMQASLLCLQGGCDPLVDDAEARQLVALRGPEGKLAYWPEGVHCLYNHAIERNSVLAQWFATELS